MISGAIAQLGERLLCTQEVGSSILPGSTNSQMRILVTYSSGQSVLAIEYFALTNVRFSKPHGLCWFFNNLESDESQGKEIEV